MPGAPCRVVSRDGERGPREAAILEAMSGDGARGIIHVDMDAFFASVEQLDDPSLSDRPLLVGGAPPRGVVAAASYEARPYGCHSAMPMAEAVRRCPHATIVRPRHGRYTDVSRAVFAVIGRFTPLIEKLSVDEAFVDVTASTALFGDAETIARRMKREVYDVTGITASAGVAPCKLVAKLASDLDKPDGLVVVGPDEVRPFLAPLPLERMWGIGPRAARQLRARGLSTLGDLVDVGPDRLERWLGSWGRTVHALAQGDDDRSVVPGAPAKSLGAEETFSYDLRTTAELERVLLAQAERVASRLVRTERCGRRVTVKLKYADFTQRTRQTRLAEPAADTDSVYEAACSLLPRFPAIERGVRLSGVAVGELQAGPPPPTLFPAPRAERRHRLEQTIASLRDRFGAAGVTRAALLDAPPSSETPTDEP